MLEMLNVPEIEVCERPGTETKKLAWRAVSNPFQFNLGLDFYVD